MATVSERSAGMAQGDGRSLKVRIATPNALIDVADGVDEVVVPTERGEVGILADHAKLVASLGTGILRFQKAGKVSFFVVSGGLVDVQNNAVLVLADVAESGMQIDVVRARESLERARKRIAGVSDDREVTTDVARALLAEQRALARLAAAEAQAAKATSAKSPSAT